MSDPLGSALTDTGCRPHIEIAWDMWARTRVICDHGTFQGVSGGLNLQESFDNAASQFNAFDHVWRCFKDCPVPEQWVQEGTWEAGETTECDLWRDHDGDCIAYPDDEAERKQRETRRHMCVPCRRELHFVEAERQWLHLEDNSEPCSK